MTSGNQLPIESNSIQREKIPFDPKTCPIFMYTAGKIISEIKDNTGEVLGTLIHEEAWDLSKRNITNKILPQVEDVLVICNSCKNYPLHRPEASFASLPHGDGTTMYAGIALDDDISMPINSK